MVKKKPSQRKENNDVEENRSSLASNNSQADMTNPEHSHDANLGTILRELREFRKDTSQNLSAIREDINMINKRMEEAEERIDTAETRIQTSEEVLAELVKLQVQTEAKLIDLEGRSRRENVRLYGVAEGAEESKVTMIAFVEDLLINGLELAAPAALNIERAHRALATKPPPEAPPRSIVVKFASFKVKEEILKKAWQRKGIDFQGKKIHVDHDYAPEVLKKRRDYTEAKAALKERNIRFQTPFPARLRVYYKEGTVTYSSAEAATADMAKRGIPVTVRKNPASLLEQINQLTWRPSGKRGRREDTSAVHDVRERLQRFRHQDSDK